MTERTIDLLAQLGHRIEQRRYRQIYSNRDLALQEVDWIGFDMDYTLAIYRRHELDDLCHRLTVDRLIKRMGYPEALREVPFDSDFAIRGLVVDRVNGNILKLNRHRQVGRGMNGFEVLPDADLAMYRRQPPNLSSRRYTLVDTLFELPETYLFAALVQLHKDLELRVDFDRLATDVRSAVDSIHADGSLKSEVTANLARYIFADPELAQALHRFRSAGKRLFLMTNSYYAYTNSVMKFLLDEVIPDYANWKQYFDVIITGATKPTFFRSTSSFLRLDDSGQVVGEERNRFTRGVAYQHGNLGDLERMIGLGADQILYIGDHIYGDILRSKRDSAWRTAMIIPEMEDELRIIRQNRALIDEWTRVEHSIHQLRDSLSFEADLLARFEASDPAMIEALDAGERIELQEALMHLQSQTSKMRRKERDYIRRSREIGQELNGRFHARWGALFKENNEHSIFGEQVASYADLYTSRVSNFLGYSPVQDFRSPRDLMPHEIWAM